MGDFVIGVNSDDVGHHWHGCKFDYVEFFFLGGGSMLGLCQLRQGGLVSAQIVVAVLLKVLAMQRNLVHAR